MNRTITIWLLAFALFIAGDIATTLLGLELGAVEANPLVTQRPTATNMLAAKALVVAVTAFGSQLLVKPYRHAPPASLAVLGALIVTWNTYIMVIL